MTPDDLQTLREGWDFEAKLAGGRDGRGCLPASVWETYAAMANTFGGRILLGARELPDGTLEAVGIADIDKVETDFWNQLNDRAKVSVNLLTRDMVTRIEVEGRTLLQIDIPKAERAHLPVHLNGSFQHNTFVRIADGDRRADPDTVRRLVADADPDRDSRVLAGYQRSDLDDASIRLYREIFAARRRDHSFTQSDELEFLRQIRVWATDRSNGAEGPTRAGLLMLGRESAIRDLYPHWHLSYKETDPEIERWSDRVWPDGTWEANVFNFYRRVFTKLVAGVKIPFALEGEYRVGETDVHRALREAFINTLVHADYAGPAGVRVIRSPAGYTFKNPGLPLVSLDQVWRGGVSVSRNPTLQHLFALVELGEREGSGGPTIRSAWRAQHWQAPSLQADLENVETHVVLGQESLLPEPSVAALTAEWGPRFTALDEVGRIALVTAHAEGKVSHARLGELVELHSRDRTLKLQELVRHKMLEPMGKGSGRSYRLLCAPPSAQAELWDPSAHSASSAGRGSGSAEVGPRSAEVGSRSAEVGSRSAEVEPRSAGAEPAADARPEVAQVAASRWARADQVREAVLAVCEGRFRTVGEIASALGRSPRTVREHLVALVAGGALELEFVDVPNHPRQAYRACDPKVPA